MMQDMRKEVGSLWYYWILMFSLTFQAFMRMAI